MTKDDLITRGDIETLEARILRAIEISKHGDWPARMKKKTAAAYMNTSVKQIDDWVDNGKLRPRYDKDPEIYTNTPAYFNREELDKLRF